MSAVIEYGSRTPIVIDTLDGALSLVENAYLALTAAVEFQSTRKIASLAVAAAAFAREANDTRLLDRATELRTRAERKAGQMLIEAAEKGERQTKGNPQMSAATTFERPTLAQIGVTRDQSSKWQQVAALSDDDFEAALDTTKAITHEISTPKVLRAVQQTRERETLATDDSVVMPPLVVATHEAQAVALYNAVRDLADLKCSVAELRAALPYYQHFRIAANVGAALALLQKVSDQWTTP